MKEEMKEEWQRSIPKQIVRMWHLHTICIPRIVQTKIYISELLHDRNYKDMRNALFVKNKIGFVDEIIKDPAANSPDLTHWLWCNSMVKDWLISTMEKELRSIVWYATIASETWVDLEERYGKGSVPRAYELRRAITLQSQEKMTVPTYYTKLKGSWV